MGTVVLKFADIKFAAYAANEHEDEDDDEDAQPGISLNVMVKDGTIPVSAHISDMVNVMVMAAIGEYESVTYIKAINFVDSMEEIDNTFTLTNLPLVLDSYLVTFNKKMERRRREKE